MIENPKYLPRLLVARIPKLALSLQYSNDIFYSIFFCLSSPGQISLLSLPLSASLNLSSLCTLWLWLSFGSGGWCIDRSFGSNHGHLRRSSSIYKDDEVFLLGSDAKVDGSGVALRTRATVDGVMLLLAAKASSIGV